MLKMGEELGIFSDPNADAFLVGELKRKSGKFHTCKKPELIRVFLESGADLTGRVPAEILNA